MRTFPRVLYNAALHLRSSAPITLRLVLTDARETSEGISAFPLLSRLHDVCGICKVAASELNLFEHDMPLR